MIVEVVYALPLEQALVRVEVPDGATAAQAIERSGLLQRFAGVDLGRQRIGVFGRVVELTQVLREGDRVEIYRPLAADPKEQRRARAVRPPRR